MKPLVGWEGMQLRQLIQIGQGGVPYHAMSYSVLKREIEDGGSGISSNYCLEADCLRWG